MTAETGYAYDNRNRLVTAEYPSYKEELYYDKAGNRTKRITSHTEETYRYDSRNRLTAYTKDGKTSQFTYDNAGNLLRDNKAVYEYDAFHRNTKVETFDGNIQINRYDAEGLRHEAEENGKLVSFLYRGTEVIAEETQEETIRYIRTQELIASDAEHAKTYYHYASDEMGSITHVAEENSVKNWYEYDAWGNLTASQETIENRFRFNGQQYDPVSQQYYLRARYYNPVIGRFTQEDTYRGDGLNLYAYCRNNPVYYVDPSGNICEPAANRIMGKIDAHEGISNNERKKLAAYLRNKKDKVGLTPDESRALEKVDRKRKQENGSESSSASGYYQDVNGRWHRQNGQFASNTEVGMPSNSDHYLNRPYIRQDTIDAVNAKTKVNYKTGQIYDSISRKWVDPSDVELGHTKGNEFAYYRDWAESQGWTQTQFNDFMNNSNFYAWQDVHSNRSHKFEAKH